MEKQPLRKVHITVEELDEFDAAGGQKFLVYLSGDKERVDQIPEKDLSPAEFWGLTLFKILPRGHPKGWCNRSFVSRP